MAEEETGTEGSEHDADTVGAGDPLFVPRLDLLLGARGLSDRGTEKDLYSWAVETICGPADDSQPVEQYAGNLGVSTAFVNSHQGPVAQVQWNNNLATIYTDPGNVSGVRWGSGTMISADLFITCGHLFDQTRLTPPTKPCRFDSDFRFPNDFVHIDRLRLFTEVVAPV